MKRLLLAGSLLLGALGCMRPWVGRPVRQLEREWGLPLRIRNEGENLVYVYPDVLAGRGQMTFTIDKDGIIRSWYATTDVPGAGDVILGDGDGLDGFGGGSTGFSSTNR